MSKTIDPPEIILPCSRCMKHGALYLDPSKPNAKDAGICGPCGSRVSLFTMPMAHDDPRQVVADEQARAHGHRLDGHEPLLWEGD